MNEFVSHGTARFEVLTQQSGAPQLVSVLELIATALAHDRFAASATAVATDLAIRLRCDRVSIGFLHNGFAEVNAISHGATQVGNKGVLREIGSAMDECVDQAGTIVHPQLPDHRPRISLAHSELARRQGSKTLCSIPLASAGKVYGAVTLERRMDTPFDASTVDLCEHIASFVGPLLKLKRLNERPWHTRMREWVRSLWVRLRNPGSLTMKVGAFSAVVALVLFFLTPTQYRLSAPARVEGTVQRALVAPVDGYLRHVHARPGDVVKADQLLAELADEELKLERRKWESEVAQAEAAYGEALAKQDRARLVIQLAKIAQGRAQLSLVEQTLARVQIVAPFDGTVIHGDLTRSLGAPVQQGEILLTLSPSNEYRVIVEAEERDLSEIRSGQFGRLTLAAMPLESIAIRIERITPLASTAEGRHFFEVEARLDEKVAQLRPGLRGIAKIEVGDRSFFWIWTHRAIEWLSVALWRWIG